MKKDLSKLYSELTGEERFKAFLAAMTRGDDKDTQRLVDTCPRKDYRTTDAAFSDRMNVTRLLAATFALDWLRDERALVVTELAIKHYLNLLQALFSAYSQGVNDNWMKGERKGLPPFPVEGELPSKEEIEAVSLAAAQEKVPEKFSLLFDIQRRKLKTTQRAFEAFCEEIDVPVEHFLSWFPFTLDWIEARSEDLAEVEPNEEALNRYLEIYRAVWTEEGAKFN